MKTTKYLTRSGIEFITGLNFRAIRRLEKRGAFPRRIRFVRREIISSTRKPVRPRWRAADVEAWVQKDEAELKAKVLSSFPHLLFGQPDIEIRAPEGFRFTDSDSHSIRVETPTGLRQWPAVWNNRPILKVGQCIKPCFICLGMDEEEPIIYRATNQDIRRYK
jgi:hypothetical protein